MAGHDKILLEQADGRFDLQHALGYGDATDLYGPGQTFGDVTSPNSRWWDGTPSGLEIVDIDDQSARLHDEIARLSRWATDGLVPGHPVVPLEVGVRRMVRGHRLGRQPGVEVDDARVPGVVLAERDHVDQPFAAGRDGQLLAFDVVGVPRVVGPPGGLAVHRRSDTPPGRV